MSLGLQTSPTCRCRERIGMWMAFTTIISGTDMKWGNCGQPCARVIIAGIEQMYVYCWNCVLFLTPKIVECTIVPCFTSIRALFNLARKGGGVLQYIFYARQIIHECSLNCNFCHHSTTITQFVKFNPSFSTKRGHRNTIPLARTRVQPRDLLL
jgi:hypothetical protein